MTSEILVALLSCAGTIIGSACGVFASAKLTNYRIAELEKKVEKHNSVIERTAVVERDVKTAFNRIDELREDVKGR